ncbi:MAG: LytR/AlgR family response regulator transcription factor [Bacteroidales bacterium]
MNIVIIEDEKLTAEDLVSILRKIDSNIEVDAILSTVEEACEYLQNCTAPDLIFSDIQLPDGTSFEVFKRLELTAPIIFCTAYNQYALQAFEVNGIDYILKPFSKDTVSKALDKYRLLKGETNYHPDTFTNLMNILKQESSASGRTSSIIVYHGDKIIPIEIDNIALLYMEDKYIFAYTFEQKKHIVSQTMEELEKKCGTLFFRANRQHLVNHRAIKDVARHLNRKILIRLKVEYSTQILVGKLKTNQLIKWLSY